MLVSVLNLFIATTTFNPKLFFIVLIWWYKLVNPFSRYSKFSFLMSSRGEPPWYFKAFIVATITTISGFFSSFRHFISKNFSAPKSAPNPASVTT